MATVEVRQYQTADGCSPFAEWLAALRDRRALQAILARIARMQAGNRRRLEGAGRQAV